jgi:hypothetical protein
MESTTLWFMNDWSNVSKHKYTIVKNVEQQINKYYQCCRNWDTYILLKYILQFWTSKEHIYIQNIFIIYQYDKII